MSEPTNKIRKSPKHKAKESPLPVPGGSDGLQDRSSVGWVDGIVATNVDEEEHKGALVQDNPYDRTSEIELENNAHSYSQKPFLYPGIGRLTPFVQQQGINPSTGKMPPGKTNPEPVRPWVERFKMGFKQYGPIAKSRRVPKISPEASGIETSTTNDEAIHTTVRDLKRELNTGMGARSNKYLLEFFMPGLNQPNPRKLNILCQATSFPQRQMNVASMWRFGRKYNLRGETNFGDSWTLTFVDDSAMTLRNAVDRWFMDIDDSKLQDTALDVYGNPLRSLYNNVRDLLSTVDGIGNQLDANAFNNFLGGLLRPEYAPSQPNYQTDIRVYQLDQVGNKVMGYVMQNAFVSEISQIDYGDDKENELTKFSITITFSEFLPLAESTLDTVIRLDRL